LKAVPYNNNVNRHFDYTNAPDTQESPIQKRKLSTDIKVQNINRNKSNQAHSASKPTIHQIEQIMQNPSQIS